MEQGKEEKGIKKERIRTRERENGTREEERWNREE